MDWRGTDVNHPLVEAWLVKFGDLARKYLITTPVAPNLAHHLNYDGIKCWLLMSDLLAARDSETSDALFAHSEATMDILAGYSGMALGPDDNPNGAPGYYNYNIGPRWMMDHPRTAPSQVDLYGRITANFARGSAYSNPLWTTYYRVYRRADGSWPDVGLGYDPINGPGFSREWSLAILSHLVSDDIYADFESRMYEGYPAVQAHRWFIPEVLSRRFLGFDSHNGLDRPYAGTVDRWREQDELAGTYGGDFTQDPEVFLTGSWRPFMFAHTCRMLMAAYNHPAIVANEYAMIFRSKIILAVSDLCDISLRWFNRPTRRGNTALVYEIAADGTLPETGAPDLSLFESSMFAWSSMMTGNQVHRDFAKSLIETGIAEGYWVWGKHWNQGVIETWNALKYLGLLSEGNGQMAINIESLRTKLDELEKESREEVAAKADVDAADVAVSEAQAVVVAEQDGRAAAFAQYVMERDEKDAKLLEIIAELQASITP
jgi:hypothetical protein